MPTLDTNPNRQPPDPKDILGRIRGAHVEDEGWPVRKPSDCEVKKEARQKYKDKGSKTQIDDIETDDDALEYLEGVRRRYEEGKTTRLP